MRKLSEDVVTIILNAVKITKDSNYYGWWDKLLFLAQMYPDINIVYDEKIERSYYSATTLTIYLNETSSVVFLHELTHMFHHLESNYYVPEDFEQLINILDRKDLVVDFANQLGEHMLQLCMYKLSKFKDQPFIKDKLFNQNLSNSNQSVTNIDNDMIELDLDSHIQDILDALVGGSGFDYGITYIKDDNSLANKSGRICGHGEDYYKIQGKIYREILANYAALTLINPNYKYFVQLKMILGEPLVELLDNEVNKYFSSNIEKVDNNNIRK